jgi:hypothetical protein
MTEIMEFTYYGDLLGIGNYYTLGPSTAHKKLDSFYYKTFSALRDFVRRNQRNKVEMFSDSLFIVGVDAMDALRELNLLHSNLLCDDLFLRGGIVEGYLSFEPRFTVENFHKNLPKDEKLAKAVGLEKTYKGARLIIENTMAEHLLEDQPDWLTNEGYMSTKTSNPHVDDILRKIAPTPDYKGYELLYYWTPSIKAIDFRARIDHLKKLRKMQDEPIAVHTLETIRLIERSEYRYKETN